MSTILASLYAREGEKGDADGLARAARAASAADGEVDVTAVAARAVGATDDDER